jgi:kumamolisin
VGAADPDEQLQAVVVLRRQGLGEFNDLADKLAAGETPTPLSRQAFSDRFGAAPADFSRVGRFARRFGLKVVRQDTASGTMVLSGTVAQFNAAFGVALQRYQHDDGLYRGCEGPLHLPEELHGIVTAVAGLDNRPQARMHFRFRPPFRVAPDATQTGYLPAQVASFYDFPESAGRGQCIALIELGGGYRAEDAKAYFSELGVAMPAVTVVSTDGAEHEPTGDPSGPDGEVMLDVEIAGALAPQAHLVLYFGANSDAGFIQAFNGAVHDSENRPSVISISWGGPEPSWTPQSLRAFNDALKAAAMMGVTVCAASGDSGASEGLPSGHHVDFPASSPYVLACGGTRLQAAGGAIERETVWNDGPQGGATGGGVSSVFGLPAWQRSLMVSTPQGQTALARRGVPDVAGNADPATGYRVLVDGTPQVVGGTSAVAPLWAALIARINAARQQPMGYVNARFYAQPAAFHDITQGDNGGYSAAPGWDACTGLGSPDGQKVADVS